MLPFHTQSSFTARGNKPETLANHWTVKKEKRKEG
jgi:hypothetical protein